MLTRRWTLLVILAALIFSVSLAACGNDKDENDKVGNTVSDAATEVSDAANDAANAIEEAADNAAGALNVVAGDAAAGATVFNEQGCTGCHSVDSDAAMTGPSLQNIGNVAEERTDQSAAEYLRESITHPDAYVVEGFPKGVMPSFDTLSDDQLDNLVAYLLTLRQ